MGHSFETIISGEMLGTLTQRHTLVLYDDIGQKTRLNQFHSVWKQQASFSLKILIGCCTDLDADSGSCSNLNYWLRLQPKMQTPAGVYSGTPAPWSSLTPAQYFSTVWNSCWFLVDPDPTLVSTSGMHQVICKDLMLQKNTTLSSMCVPVVFAHLQCGIDPKLRKGWIVRSLMLSPRQTTNRPRRALTSMFMEVTYKCRLLGLSLLLALADFVHM